MCDHMAQGTARHACTEDGNLETPSSAQRLVEIFGWIGGGRFVVGLGFDGVVACMPR